MTNYTPDELARMWWRHGVKGYLRLAHQSKKDAMRFFENGKPTFSGAEEWRLHCLDRAKKYRDDARYNIRRWRAFRDAANRIATERHAA